jgi:hypothetical protein
MAAPLRLAGSGCLTTHDSRRLTGRARMAAPGILCGIVDGEPIPPDVLAAAFGASSGDKLRIEVVPGSELKQAGSHTAVLCAAGATEGAGEGGQQRVFLKKVTAAHVAHRPWIDRRRVLLYIRNELRLYAEFAQELREAGVSIAASTALESRNLDGIEALEEEPPPEVLRECGALMFIAPLSDPARYMQGSPLSLRQAAHVLRAVARLHAAAWGRVPLLQRAATRLQRHGGSFALASRNPKELANMVQSWGSFCEAFGSAAAAGVPPGFFARPEVAALGQRMMQAAPWLAAQLSPAPDDASGQATLVHGDLKAMNVFVPTADAADAGEGAVLIDWASTGVGLGMADVAFFLAHSIAPHDLDGGGDEALLDEYLQELQTARAASQPPPPPQGAAAVVEEYPRAMALRHFRLATCDYGRFVMGRFWGSATPESFRAKHSNPNVTLPNRDVAAMLRFVTVVERYLGEFEQLELPPCSQPSSQ